MHPWITFSELLEEQRRRDRASRAATGVLDVSDIRLDQLL